MSPTTTFGNPYDERMKVVMEFTNERDSSLHVKINPKEYFYPYISIWSDEIYDEEEGLSRDDFQREKTIIRMLGENGYKEILRQRFANGLDNYLRAVQAEAELEFKEKESFEQKVAKNEEIIFKLIKKKGPGIFRYNAVIKEIQNWCDEKDNAKIGKLTKALKEYGKSLCGSVTYSSFEQRYYFVVKYERISGNIRTLKKDITARRKTTKDDSKLKREIIERWAKESPTLTLQNKSWFELLLTLAKKEEGKNGTGFIHYIKTTSPRELAIGIFSEVINRSRDMIDKILRDRNNIMKKMAATYRYDEHRFWWDLDVD